MRYPRWIFSLALPLAVSGALASGSSTGGAIGNLIPAPKFLKGSITGSVYTAPNQFFSVASPHKQDTYEYSYMKVKEVYSTGDLYLSFGPAALDQSIYRIEIAKRPRPGVSTMSVEDAAPALIDHDRKQLSRAYGGDFRLEERSDQVISGRRAVYFHFGQTAAAGRMMSDRAVEIDYQAYVLDFGSAVAVVWVQSPRMGAKSGMDAKAFAESLYIPSAGDLKIDRDGYYRFNS